MNKSQLVSIFLVAVLILGGFFLLFKKSSQTSTDLVDTTNWPTYQNDKFGYQIKYPKDYQVNEQFDSVIFVPPITANKESFLVSVLYNNAPYKDNYEATLIHDTILSRKNITIDGINATEIYTNEKPGNGDIYYRGPMDIIYHNDKVYVISSGLISLKARNKPGADFTSAIASFSFR